MSKSIKPEELQEALKEYMSNYLEDIEEGVKEKTKEITKEAVEELKQISPRGYGRKEPYYKGWTKQKGKVSRRKIYCKNS